MKHGKHTACLRLRLEHFGDGEKSGMLEERNLIYAWCLRSCTSSNLYYLTANVALKYFHLKTQTPESFPWGLSSRCNNFVQNDYTTLKILNKTRRNEWRDTRTNLSPSAPALEGFQRSPIHEKITSSKLYSNSCSAALFVCICFMLREKFALLFQTFSRKDPPGKAPRRGEAWLEKRKKKRENVTCTSEWMEIQSPSNSLKTGERVRSRTESVSVFKLFFAANTTMQIWRDSKTAFWNEFPVQKLVR